jgi:hypothetical protein
MPGTQADRADRLAKRHRLLPLDHAAVGCLLQQNVLLELPLQRAGLGLAHARRLEAPVVAAVQRRGVDHQHRHLDAPPGIARDGMEAPIAAGVDAQLAHLDRPGSIAVPHRAIQPLVQDVAEPVGARIVRARHAEVRHQVREGLPAQVGLDDREEVTLHLVDQLDQALGREVALRVELALQIEVVERADNRAAGHAGEHLDLAQKVELGETGEHADVEQGRPEAAAGQSEAEPDRRALGLRFGTRSLGRFAHGALSPSMTVTLSLPWPANRTSTIITREFRRA